MINNISMLALGLAIGKTDGTFKEIYDFLQSLSSKEVVNKASVKEILNFCCSYNRVILSSDGIYRIVSAGTSQLANSDIVV